MAKGKSKQELVRMLLRNSELGMSDEELFDLLIDQPIAIDVDKQEESKKTFGDHVADKVSEIAGSWTFIIISIWFIGGLQMISIGVIGEYIGKIYNETKSRPRYIIETVIDN